MGVLSIQDCRISPKRAFIAFLIISNCIKMHLHDVLEYIANIAHTRLCVKLYT